MGKYHKEQGAVVSVGELKEFGNFKVQEIVLETTDNPEYPNPVKFQFTNDNCDLSSGLKVGQEVEVSFRVDGRYGKDKYEGKIFNNNTVVELAHIQGVPQTDSVPEGVSQAAEEAENKDPLPF